MATANEDLNRVLMLLDDLDSDCCCNNLIFDVVVVVVVVGTTTTTTTFHKEQVMTLLAIYYSFEYYYTIIQNYPFPKKNVASLWKLFTISICYCTHKCCSAIDCFAKIIALSIIYYSIDIDINININTDWFKILVFG